MYTAFQSSNGGMNKSNGWLDIATEAAAGKFAVLERFPPNSRLRCFPVLAQRRTAAAATTATHMKVAEAAAPETRYVSLNKDNAPLDEPVPEPWFKGLPPPVLELLP